MEPREAQHQECEERTQNAMARDYAAIRSPEHAVVNRTFVNLTTAFLSILLVSFTLIFLTHLVGQGGGVRAEDLGARQTGSAPAR